MTRQDFELRMRILEARAPILVMQQAPVKTGKLKSAIKTEKLPGGGFRVYIDQGLAPHAKYTNESWSRGKNPNEDWFDDAGKLVARAVASTLGSTPSNK